MAARYKQPSEREAVKVAVGTRNPMKVRAVRLAFSWFFDALVEGVSVETGLPEQPVGYDVVRGALERAVKARAVAEADFGVGVEAGPMPFPAPTGYLETQVAIIVGPGGKVSMGLSPSFEVPPSLTRAMLAGIELSRAYSEKRGSRDLGESIGYIGVKTRGLVTRQDLTFHAVVMALVPWLEGGSWLPGVEDFAASLRELV